MSPASRASVRRLFEGERALAVAAVVVGWIALVAPIFAHSSFWFRDQSALLYPLRIYVRERLLRGEVPLWNPHFGVGRPLLSWILPAALDPLNALLLLPVPFGQDLYNAVHLLIACVGALLWLRAQGRGVAAATLGAVSLAYGAVFASCANSLGPYLWGNAFAPWALLLLTRAADDVTPAASLRRAVLVGLVLAQMVLSGDPMSVWFVAFLGAAQCLSAERARVRSLATLAGGGAVAVLVAAAQLLPALALAGEHRRGGVSRDLAMSFSLAPVRLIELVAATPWGTPYTSGWRVLDNAARVETLPFITSLYVGAGALALAMLGAVRARRLAPFAALAALALLLALGRHTPVFPAWFAVALPARMFRYPEKHLVLFALALAPLVAAGFDQLLDAARGRAAWALGGAVALCAGAGVAAAAMPAAPGVPASLLRAAGVLAAAALALHLASRRGWSRAALAWALVALGAVDVVSASVGVLSYAPSWIYQRPSRITRRIRRDLPTERLVRVVRPAELRTFSDAQTAFEYWDSLAPDMGTWHGLAHVSSYETERDLQWEPLLGALRRDPVRLWRLTGVRYVAQPPAALQGMPPSWVVGSLQRYNLALVRVPDPAPRAFLAHRATAARSPTEALALLREPTFDPARDAVVEGGDGAGGDGRCALVEDRVEALTLRCDAARGGWVVVTDAYAAGWSAAVDGRAARIHRANGILRAVRVPAGASVVSMRYAPWGFRAGCLVSAAALLGCVVTLLATRRRGRGA